MAALILPSRRVVQPQGPVEVDPRYRGAVARLNIPAISLIDLATGQAATTTGSATSTAIFSNRQGFEKQVHPSSGALGYSSWSWGPDDGITDDATFLFVGHPQNYSTANGGLIVRGLTSAWNLGLYYTNSNTLNAGTVTGSPVAGFTASIGSLSLTIGDEQRCLLSRRGGLITVYNWRTRQQASTSVTGTGLRNSTSGIIIGATISSGAASHQRHALTAALKQGVTDNEAWALLDNPWQLFRPLQRRIWVPVAGGAAIITASQSGSWSVRNNVSALQAGSWSVRNLATATQAGAWSVRSSVSTTQAAAWSVRNYASATQPGAFSVRNYAAATQPSAWSVRNLASALQAGAWSVENAAGTASALQSGSWSVRNLAAATQPASWSVRNTATTTAPGAWSVRNAVQATQAGAWKVSVYAATLQGSSWTVRNYAGATQAGAWSLDEAGRVTASQPGSWSVRNLVSASQPGAWSVRQMVAAAQAAAWSVRNFTSTSQASAWSVRGYVSVTQAGAWSVTTQPTAFQSGAWSVGFDIATGPAFYVSTVPSVLYVSKANSTLYVSKAD